MKAQLIMLGDFNVDDGERLDSNYSYSNFFDDVDETFWDSNIIQLIDFVTWTTLVNNLSKSLILDHLSNQTLFAAIELKQIITANYYSILYYNLNIWHLPTLALKLKQKLLSAFGDVLKLRTLYCPQDMSFITLHHQTARATPNQMLKFKLSIQLYKTFNTQHPPLEWVSLNENICSNRRQVYFETIEESTSKMGKFSWAINSKF